MKHTRYNEGIIRPRGNKWLAEINHNYTRRRKVFASPEACKTWLNTEYLQSTNTIRPLSPRNLIDANDARTLLPAGVTLSDAVKYWLAEHKDNPLSNATLEDLYRKYLDDKISAGLRPRSIIDIRTNIGRLVIKLGKIPVSHVTPLILHDLVHSRKYSPVTRNNLRRYWLGFFAYCRKLGAITSNPAEALAVSRVDETMPEIFTPQQTHALLKTVKKEKRSLLPAIAIGLFAGLRTSELLALKWKDISNTHIRVIPEVAKRRRQRLIAISPTLRPFMVRRKQGLVCPLRHRRFYFWLRQITEKMGLKNWPHNVMRHSFASYHLALYQDAGKTASILGHTQSASVLWDHYRELCSKTDARRYFNPRI